MPALIRIEKTDGPTRKYERGWNYVETRNGRLCMVRNKKDGFDLHRGGWMKTKPRERIVREVLLVEPDTEPAHHRPVDHRDGRVIINLRTPRHYRGESSDDSLQHISRPRIQVRRPITAPASTTYQIYEPRHHHPHYHYVDEIESQLVQKTPVQRAQFHRYRREPITEEDTYCEEHQYDYDDCFDTTNMPTREPRPYHHSSDEENSYWDDDLDAWMVDRKPKVRFE